jgi:signal transduction histidine kinase
VYSALSQEVWRPRTSVKIRFALAQGFFIAVVISLLAATLYFPVKNRIVTITDNSYKILSDNLKSSIFITYQSGDRQSVVNAVRLVAGQEGVKYVMVLDNNNKVYYDTITGSQSLEGQTYSDSLTPQVEKVRDTVIGKVLRNNVEYYNYVAPFVSKNEIVYTIRLGVDQQVIDGEFNQLARLFIYLGSLGIFIGILAAYFLAARLTKPIIKLTESALAIRAGNLNAYPDITTNDELEQLSREFQGMVEKLKQYYFQEYTQKKEAVHANARLEEINTRLQELDHQKTDFLNTASHQLRTPLSIIHWSLSLIVEEAGHMNIPAPQLELLEESLKSTKRMVDLVNDLLDVSRIEQGRKELDWAKGNYAKVCNELVKALQPLATNKKLQLTYEQKGNVADSYLDEKAFYQVVNNFVDNAIKYTAEGYVKVFCSTNGDRIEIKIQDSGIGMGEEEKKRLFTRFARGEEASKMFANGSGLGMYVAKAILKQHGGEIDVESEKGKGTTFILSVPIYDEIPTTLSASGDIIKGKDEQYAQVGATTSHEEPSKDSSSTGGKSAK